ncbi:MAG: B12-binding domain-containing protein, partial [Candidatus Bathyarchaeia archaeon]
MTSNILDALKDALINMDAAKVIDLVNKALTLKLDPIEIIGVLRSGMDEVGRRFESGEYFISELVRSGEIMKRA